MSAMIARYLKDFGAPAFPAADVQPLDDGPFGFPALEQPEPPPTPETIRREAYAEGHEAATADLAARHAQAMAALTEHYEQELATLRENHEEQVANLLATQIVAVTDELSRAVTDAAAQALLPFLGEMAARRAVADLAGLLKTAMDEGEAGRVRIRCAEASFRRLSALMGDRAALLDFEESAGLDVTAEIGSSVLMTRLNAFAAGLEKVMASPEKVME